MRIRLRPAHTPEKLAELYPTPHDHRRWSDHKLRVDVITQVCRYLFTGGSVADLSCGNGMVATSLGTKDVYLGDFAPGYGIHGPIEETIHQIPKVDLFLCCETLEHLDDPDAVLRSIRAKAHMLVLSTPLGETEGENEEHYWGWDTEGVREMLQWAEFNPVVQMVLGIPECRVAYQIWGCR